MTIEYLEAWRTFLQQLASSDELLHFGLGIQGEDPEALQDWGVGLMPVDTLPLFSTGGNGHRFAVLTDFGAQPDFQEAPIVFDTHTSMIPLQVIAHGTSELLGLLAVCGHVEVLEAVVSDDESLEDAREDWLQDEQQEESKRAVEILTETWEVPWIRDPLAHARRAAKKRRGSVKLDEGFGIGVLPTPRSTPDPRSYDADWKDPDKLAEYLSKASHDEVLGAVRTAQAHWILDPGHDGRLAAPIGDALRSLGYEEEAERWRIACEIGFQD